MAARPRVIIIGAGLSGLSCAYYLEQIGIAPIILEKEDCIGGRLATERLEGFLLDRGFQVLQSSYLEVKRLGILPDLGCAAFQGGAMLRHCGEWKRLLNPFRHPLGVVDYTKLPVGWTHDLYRLARLYLSGFTSFLGAKRTQRNTIDLLKHAGISDAFIHDVLRPLFSGVFLETDLATDSEIFLRLLPGFIHGKALLPRMGMASVPRALAARLRQSEIRTGVEVKEIHSKAVILKDGSRVDADAVVMALSGPQATRLLPHLPHQYSRSVTSLYYRLPCNDLKVTPLLHIGAEDEGPINNLAFNSAVQPTYAPVGQHLISVTVVSPAWQDADDLESAVLDELYKWFGVKTWTLIKKQIIAHALPDQSEPPKYENKYTVTSVPGVFLCGEHTGPASINGALLSGRKAAEVVASSLR